MTIAGRVEVVDVVTSMRVRAATMVVIGFGLVVGGAVETTPPKTLVALGLLVVGGAVDYRMTPGPKLEAIAASAGREPAGAVRRPVRYAARVCAIAALTVGIFVVLFTLLGPAAAVGAEGALVGGGVSRLVRARQLLASERRARVRLSAVASVRPRFPKSVTPTYYLTPEHLR